MRGSVSQTRTRRTGAGPPRRGEDLSGDRPRSARKAAVAGLVLAAVACGPAAVRAAPPPPSAPAPAVVSAACPHACGAPGPEVDVRNFGAIADDDRPDDDAIRRALATLPPGSVLVLPPGRYIQAHSLVIDRPGVTLRGVEATLQATDPHDHALVLQADATGVLGLRLTARPERRGDRPEQSRLVLRGAGQRVRDVRIDGAASAGVLVLGASDFAITGTEVRGTLADGIHVTGASHRGCILGNRVRDAGDDLISVVSYEADAAPVRDVLVAGNEVAGGRWGRGLSVVGGEHITLRDNRIADVLRAAGILIAREGSWHTRGVDEVRVEGNRLERIGRPQDAARAAGAPTGHAAVEVHRWRVPPRLPGIGRLHVADNRVDDSGVPALHLGDGRQDPAVLGARVDCAAGAQ